MVNEPSSSKPSRFQVQKSQLTPKKPSESEKENSDDSSSSCSVPRRPKALPHVKSSDHSSTKKRRSFTAANELSKGSSTSGSETSSKRKIQFQKVSLEQPPVEYYVFPKPPKKNERLPAQKPNPPKVPPAILTPAITPVKTNTADKNAIQSVKQKSSPAKFSVQKVGGQKVPASVITPAATPNKGSRGSSGTPGKAKNQGKGQFQVLSIADTISSKNAKEDSDSTDSSKSSAESENSSKKVSRTQSQTDEVPIVMSPNDCNISTAEVRLEFLEAHNDIRKDHGAPPLVICPKLNDIAQKQALKEANGQECDKVITKRYGVNSGSLRTVEPPDERQIRDHFMTLFYRNGEEYDFSHRILGAANDFTQLVWHDTRRIGVGLVMSKERKMFKSNVVIIYDPPGNHLDVESYAANVFPRGTSMSNRPATNSKEPLSSIDLPTVVEEVRKHHNYYRSIHGSPPLVRDSAADANAQRYAEKLAARDQGCNIKISEDDGYGQNIFLVQTMKMTIGAKYLASKSTGFFYEELKLYDFQNLDENRQKNIGHFAQMVWYDTKKIGVGAAAVPRKDGWIKVYLCFKYSPQADLSHPDSYFLNVFPKGSNLLQRSIVERSLYVRSLSREIIRLHNEKRALHGCYPLEVDPNLNKVAQKRVDLMLNQNMLIADDSMAYGENIFMVTKSRIPSAEDLAETLFTKFYRQGENYNYDDKLQGNVFEKTGNFTQMIWYDTERIGVGYGFVQPKGSYSIHIFICLKYAPPGNTFLKTSFDDNVFPPGTKLVKRNRRVVSEPEEPVLIDKEVVAYEIFMAHNELRSKHGSPKLEYDPELAKGAKLHAQKMADENQLSPDGDGRNGEAIFSKKFPGPPNIIDPKALARECIMSLYNQRYKGYDFQNPAFEDGKQFGYFTQMIWHSTTKIGIGSAINIQNQSAVVYISLKYYPQGNVPLKELYALNVFPEGTPANHRMTIERKSIDAMVLAQEVTRVHNEYRLRLGSNPLRLDFEISKKCQAHAMKMHSLRNSGNMYDEDSTYEEVYEVFRKVVLPSARELADEFCKKIFSPAKLHDRTKKSPSAERHSRFVNLVWRDARRIGVGLSVHEDKSNPRYTSYAIYIDVKYDAKPDEAQGKVERVPTKLR